MSNANQDRRSSGRGLWSALAWVAFAAVIITGGAVWWYKSQPYHLLISEPGFLYRSGRLEPEVLNTFYVRLNAEIAKEKEAGEADLENRARAWFKKLEDGDVSDTVFDDTSSAPLLYWIVGGQAILAFAEELYYRGLLLNEMERLSPRLGVRSAAGSRPEWSASLATASS